MDVFYAFTLGAYLMGSIPFGLILAHTFLKKDIRKQGSGNIGTTNVLRIGGKKLAAATLLLDALKGILIILIYKALFPYDPQTTSFPPNVVNLISLILGLFAIIGHCYPVWLKFKGGKGFATTLGVLLAAVPYAGLAACLSWLLTAKITKYSSLSALVAVIVAPIVTLFIYGSMPAIICLLITSLVFWRHKDNIKRLRDGSETKIGQKKQEATDEADEQ